MNFVVKLLNSPRDCNAIWVIMDCLTKSAHFLPVKTTYFLSKYATLYKDCMTSWYISFDSVESRPKVCVKILEKFAKGFKQLFPSTNEWAIRKDHPNSRGYVMTMRT